MPELLDAFIYFGLTAVAGFLIGREYHRLEVRKRLIEGTRGRVFVLEGKPYVLSPAPTETGFPGFARRVP